MINANMKYYDFFTLDGIDEYGQPALSKKKGSIKMSITVNTLNVADNMHFKDYTYIGLTHSALDDSYVIKYGDELLKVLYVNTQGRLNQVYLKEYA